MCFELEASARTLDVLALLDTLVRPAALCGGRTWPSHAAILQAANTIQLRLLRDAKQPKKLKGEDWKTWNQSCQSENAQGRGRAVVHVHTGADLETPFYGQIACSPTNLPFLQWRDLGWSEQEKKNPRGARHSKRFNPNLDVERGIVKTAGLLWKQLAVDRPKWGDLETDYSSQHDVPWSSGKQLSIHNLCPGQQHVSRTAPAIHNECPFTRESCEGKGTSI